MADSRQLTFGVKFQTDEKPLDKLREKEKQIQTESEKAEKKIAKIGTSLQHVGTNARSAFNSVAGSGQRMGTDIQSAMLKSITSGKSLGSVLKSGLSAAISHTQTKFKAFGTAGKSVFRDVTNAIKHPVQTIKASLGTALNQAVSRIKGLGDTADKSGSKLERMGNKGKASGEGLIGVLKRIGAAALAITVVTTAVSSIGKFCSSSTEAAASAEETISKFETVFKESAGGLDEWTATFSTDAKRSKNEIRSFLSDAGAMFNGVGLSSSASAAMSKNLTTLAYDLASFNNIEDQDAFDKLKSGIMGEAEGLKSLGVVLNEATLKQSMLRMGLTGTFNELDEATKIQVRYNTILAQTADAQGDVTRTSGSYTNSVKGIKGVWSDFLAEAGSRFTPTLTSMFNVILDKWPSIEPSLMGLVDLLANGLGTAAPIVLELGQQCLPLLTSGLSLVFQVLTPVIPVVGKLASVVLPPLISIISLLTGTLLPPIVDILSVITMSILPPLMPVIETLANSLLPPIATILGVVSPVLQAISPLLEIICTVLTAIAEVIGKIVGWVANGIGKVFEFFFGASEGAKTASADMSAFGQQTQYVTSQVSALGNTTVSPTISPVVNSPDMSTLNADTQTVRSEFERLSSATAKPVIEPVVKMPDTSFLNDIGGGTLPAPQVEPITVDTSQYTASINTASDDATSKISSSCAIVQNNSVSALNTIGSQSSSTYNSLASTSVSAWNRSSSAATSCANNTVFQINRIKSAQAGLGSVSVGTSLSAGIKHNARGTDNWEGGPTIINEDGGELAILPSGSKVIPADKTDRILSRSNRQKTSVFSPNIELHMHGGSSADEDALLKKLDRLIEEKYREFRDADADAEALDEALV